MTILAVSLPVGQIGSRSSKYFGEKVVGQKEGSHASSHCHATEIAQGTGPNTTKDIIGKSLRGDRGLASALQNFNFVVQVIVKVGRDRRRVDGANVNPQSLELNVQTAGQLVDEGLGRPVHARKGSRDPPSDAGRKDDTSLPFIGDHFSNEMMRHIHGRRCIAFDVGEQLS